MVARRTVAVAGLLLAGLAVGCAGVQTRRPDAFALGKDSHGASCPIVAMSCFTRAIPGAAMECSCPVTATDADPGVLPVAQPVAFLPPLRLEVFGGLPSVQGTGASTPLLGTKLWLTANGYGADYTNPAINIPIAGQAGTPTHLLTFGGLTSTTWELAFGYYTGALTPYIATRSSDLFLTFPSGKGLLPITTAINDLGGSTNNWRDGWFSRNVISGTAGPTAGAGTGITVNNNGLLTRGVYKVTITFAGCVAAALTCDQTLFTLPAKSKLVSIYADTTVAYTGTGMSGTIAITTGKTAGGVEYLVSHDVKSATIRRGLVDGDLGTSINRANAIQGGDLPSFTSTTAVTARLTSGTGNIGTGAATNILTGSTTFYAVVEALP